MRYSFDKLLVLPILMIMCIWGCSTTKYLPNGEKFYSGGSVKLSSEENIKAKGSLKSEIEDILRPQPNRSFLGFKPGLWSYYKNQQEKTGIIAKYIYKKYGEEPVYLSHLQSGRTINLILNRLENRGYFSADVTHKVDEKNKRAEVIYQIRLPSPYQIETYKYEGDTTMAIGQEIQLAMSQQPILKMGDRYNLEKLKAERERIDQRLKNRGYYYFHPDFLLFKADTNQYNYEGMDLFLTLKKGIPDEARIPFKIQEIIVYPNYQVTNESQISGQDTTFVDEIAFVQKDEAFKPHILRNYILFKPDDIYQQRIHNLSANRLSAIGNFRFVNIRFYSGDSLMAGEDGYGRLKSGVYLSPFNKRSLRFEMQALSKSNNFAGPNLMVSYRNRNIFHGGELFGLSGKFGFETQVLSGHSTGLNSFEFGLEADLIIPRLVMPFRIRQRFSYSVPKTRVALSFSVLERVQLYRLHSLSGSLGYQWNASRYASHEIYPISLNFIGISRKSTDFEEILQSNAFLRKSFDQQFIEGLTYTFQFSHLANKEKIHRFFVRFNTDLSGNTISLLNTIGGRQGANDFLGENFSRYSRFDLDLRHYLRIDNNRRLITRAFAGVGFSHGDSETIPYIKQFFAGGPNSIRAFPIRSLGPGSYRSQEDNLSSFFDQSGDVKLEGNIEYRFPIISYLKGALFLDAGNIWLLKENETLPGSRFTADWIKQLALGTGIGFRIDFDLFVIRLDLGTPLHNPAADGDKWQKSFQPWQRNWRKEFLVWNFAIGYPF